MHSDVQSLGDRVDRLERQNRRLRWLLVALPIVALLVGAQGQQAVRKGKTVVAEEFILTDSDGKTRGSLKVEKDGARFVLMDKDGRVRVNVAADSDGNGPALFLVSVKDKVVATLRDHKEFGSLLYLFTDDGKPVLRAGRTKGTGVGFVDFLDGKGQFKGAVGGQ